MLRRAGHSALIELAGRSLKAQFKQAGKAQVRYVAICGEEGIALKDMESGEQSTIDRNTLLQRLDS